MNPMDVVLEYFDDVALRVVRLQKLSADLQKIMDEYQVATPKLRLLNLEAQAALLDTFFLHWETFQNDTDITGLRIKELADSFLVEARKSGLKDLATMKKKKWKLQW